MNDWMKLSGLNEDASDALRLFAEKRGAGAEKIANAAKEKAGYALLTYHHFKVKLPYYADVADGKYDFDALKKEYISTCSELHSHMNKIEDLGQNKFQELVGRLEVIGELLIRGKS